MQAQFMLNFPSVGQKALSEFVYLNLCYSKDPTNGELWSVCDLIVEVRGVYIAEVARRRLALHNEDLIVPLVLHLYLVPHFANFEETVR